MQHYEDYKIEQAVHASVQNYRSAAMPAMFAGSSSQILLSVDPLGTVQEGASLPSLQGLLRLALPFLALFCHRPTGSRLAGGGLLILGRLALCHRWLLRLLELRECFSRLAGVLQEQVL
jgi:hypothetical protein